MKQNDFYNCYNVVNNQKFQKVLITSYSSIFSKDLKETYYRILQSNGYLVYLGIYLKIYIMQIKTLEIEMKKKQLHI